MSDDTIEVKLPSGKIAIVRNYTTRKDDDLANKLLYAGVIAKPTEDGKATMDFPVENVTASQECYIPRLTMSIDGDSNVTKLIEELRSTDYEVLEETITKIVEENSPKAKKATSV